MLESIEKCGMQNGEVMWNGMVLRWDLRVSLLLCFVGELKGKGRSAITTDWSFI